MKKCRQDRQAYVMIRTRIWNFDNGMNWMDWFGFGELRHSRSRGNRAIDFRFLPYVQICCRIPLGYGIAFSVC